MWRKGRWIIVLASAVWLAAACGSEGSGAVDAITPAADADNVVDAAAIAPQPTQVVQSNGGGRAASTNFQVQIHIAGPQPAGSAQSPSYRGAFGSGQYH